jgi:hypothetical protein
MKTPNPSFPHLPVRECWPESDLGRLRRCFPEHDLRPEHPTLERELRESGAVAGRVLARVVRSLRATRRGSGR